MDAVRDLDDAELFKSLDWNRSVVVRKLEGLTFDTATKVRTPTGLTLLSVVADYLAAVERSREIVRQLPSLHVQSVLPHDHFGIVTVRWILLHMTTETTRHAGHMDILRELTDGQTGY